jgi:hypothetical protein
MENRKDNIVDKETSLRIEGRDPVNCLTTEIKQKETFREGEKRLKEEMEG